LLKNRQKGILRTGEENRAERRKKGFIRREKFDLGKKGEKLLPKGDEHAGGNWGQKKGGKKARK